MIYSDHPELVPHGSETCSPDSCKHVLRYLKGTVDYGIKYDENYNINLQTYVDLDWEGSATDRKSTSSWCFNLGSGIISWFNRKQSCVALSTVRKQDHR